MIKKEAEAGVIKMTTKFAAGLPRDSVEKIESVFVGQVGGVIAEVPVPKYGRDDLPPKYVPLTMSV